MDGMDGSRNARRVTFGLILIAAGLLLAFGRMGWLRGLDFEHWWPLLFVAWGLGRLFLPRTPRDVGTGVSTLLFGAWLQAVTLDWHHLTFVNSWPLAFVCTGVGMVVRAIAEALYSRPERKEGCC